MKTPEIQLGRFTFHTVEGVLSGAYGEKVELRYQATEVLKFLANNPNAIVEKDQLVQSIWDGRHGAEDGLIQCIAEIRRVLADSEKSIVETIPRKGYRLVVNLPDASPTGNGLKAAIGAGLVVLVMAFLASWWMMQSSTKTILPKIAVLPFEHSGQTDHGSDLGNAVSETIISSLARYSEFSVIAPQSSFRFRDSTKSIREIGEVLGADFVVQGSQMLNDRTLRIAVQLIDTRDGTLVFVDAFEIPLERMFETNGRIAFRVANTVSGALVDLSAQTTHREGEVDALILDNRARRLFQTGPSKEKWQAALALHEEAIGQFPDAEWGYLGRALMLRAGVRFGWEAENAVTVLNDAKRLAIKSIELAPQNYMTHFALARVLMQQGEISEAIVALERSVELNPSSALVLNGLGQSYIYAGDIEAVQTVTAKVAEIDPLPGVLTLWVRAWGQWLANECEAAQSSYSSMPTKPIAANKLRAVIAMCLGETESAIKAIDAYRDKHPDWSREVELDTNAANWMVDGPRDRWLAALADAGMPN